MLLTPSPGVNLDNLIHDLRSVRSAASGVRSGSGTTAQVYVLDYLDWAGQAARTLSYQISEGDLRTLVLTPRYEALLSSFGTIGHPSREAQRVVRDVVRLELEQRLKDFDAAIKTLESYKDRWSNLGDMVVLDTNFYVEHPAELIDTNLAQVTATTTPGWWVHVLVPLLVVDELDRLKRHGDTKTRARAALKMLDEVFKRVSEEQPVGVLRPAEDAVKADGSLGLGPITMELLFDPPEHERLPDNDAEIVDRALAVQTLAGRDVTMVTYDKSMSFRARHQGLKDLWLPHPPEPEGGQSRSQRRRSEA